MRSKKKYDTRAKFEDVYKRQGTAGDSLFGRISGIIGTSE